MQKRLRSSRILVTGAAGFIGSHLVEYLVDKGKYVRCFVRKGDNLEILPKKNVEIIVGDITDKRSLAPAVSGVEIIYHLAAKTDFEGKTWDEYFRPNVLGTQNLIDLATSEQVKKLVFFSTIRVIGLKDSRIPVDESAPYNPLNFYDRSKCEAEQRLFQAYQESKLPIIIIRPTSVYGPRDKGTYYSFFKAIAGGNFFLIGNGENLVSFVYVGNVVQAALLAAEKEKAIGQVYFINDEHSYTMRQLASTIASAFDKKIPTVTLPKPLGYLAGYIFLGASKILGGRPALTPEKVKNLTINYVFDIGKAKKDLGFKPRISLAEGVRRTAVWYRECGWI